MAHTNLRKIGRTKRFNIRATPEQEKLIRTGADTAGVSMTDFIVNSACLQAEHVLAARKEFIASPMQWQAFLDLLDRPARIKPQLVRLFSESRTARDNSRK
jgi:uncharacterized protein (DUF1778 family)